MKPTVQMPTMNIWKDNRRCQHIAEIKVFPNHLFIIFKYDNGEFNFQWYTYLIFFQYCILIKTRSSCKAYRGGSDFQV